MVMKHLNLYSSLELQPGKRQRCKPTFIMLLHLCEGVRANLSSQALRFTKLSFCTAR